MAPTISDSIDLLSRSLTTILKARDDPITPIVSIFALVLSTTSPQITSTALSLVPRSSTNSHLSVLFRSLRTYTRSQISAALSSPPSSSQDPAKRQSSGQYILVIPTTYQGLNSGPSPVTVVGITLGVVGGILLIMYILYNTFGWPFGDDTDTVREEEIIRHRNRSGSRRRSSRGPNMSEVRTRVTRNEEIIVEERRSDSPSAIEVEEYDEEDEDVVEVIEENSVESEIVVKEKKKKKSKSRREGSRERRDEGVSGFRIVDPLEPGGGSAPRRKISRRDR